MTLRPVPDELVGCCVLGPADPAAVPEGFGEGWVLGVSLVSTVARGLQAAGWELVPSGPRHVLAYRRARPKNPGQPT